MPDLTLGLSSTEARRRLQHFGENTLTAKQDLTPVTLFLKQFTSPLIYVLLLATIATFSLGEIVNGLIIGCSILINAALGYYQEFKAQESLQHLRSLVKPHSLVWRDGQPKLVPSTELVPEDVVTVNPEYSIPADGNLIEADQLLVNEAILTGESLPVTKTVGQTIAMGTTVIGGHGVMTVTETGMRTKMGEIGTLVTTLQEENTPLQKQISQLARWLLGLILVLLVVFVIIGLWNRHPFVELLTTSIALAVAAIPEGLVITITVILTVGMQKILRRKVIVRRLLAAETLGATTVVCTDKTGTLTKGQLTVTRSRFTDKSMAMLAGFLLNKSVDPLEVAMRDWLENQPGFGRLEEKAKQYEARHRLPFHPDRKYAAGLYLNTSDNTQLITAMGAPEVLLTLCQLSAREQRHWERIINRYARKGYRLLGFATRTSSVKVSKLTKNTLNGLTWNGLLVYSDPLRPHLQATLRKCAQAGIRVIMITGDYPATAVAIANTLKILPQPFSPSQILTGDQLEALSPKELTERIPFVQVYARITPVQKLKIVQALKKKGEVVAMTGDGVNDAPALKQADIGIVVNEASDVSKETADLILINSNFRSIVNAIKEGRVIFSNIQKVLVYLLSDSMSEIVLILVALLLQLPIPLTAAQILWINLVEDVFPSLALSFEPAEKGTMSRPPRRFGEPVINGSLQVLIALITFTGTIIVSIMYLIWTTQHTDLTYIRTLMLAAVAMNSLLYVFSCRTLSEPLWSASLWKNGYLFVAVLTGIVLLIGAVYLPPLQIILETTSLALTDWYIIILICLGSMIFIELGKWLLRSSYLNKSPAIR